MKTDLFQSCGHCWVFQICWHIECSTFTASSSRIVSKSSPYGQFVSFRSWHWPKGWNGEFLMRKGYNSGLPKIECQQKNSRCFTLQRKLSWLFRAMILQMLEQKHLGRCYICKFSSPTSNLRHQNFRWWSTALRALTTSPSACSNIYKLFFKRICK